MSFEVIDNVNIENVHKILRNNKYLLNDYYKKTIDKESYIQSKVNSYINDDFKIVKIILEDGELQGLYSLERLDWDSKVFSRNMWKMELIINTNISDDIYKLREDLIKECKKHKIDHISCRIRSKDSNSAYFLEQMGFKITGSIIRFGTDLRSYEVKNGENNSFTSISIRPYEDTDYYKVLNVVKEVFYDYPNRFRNDNSFTKKQCEKFYLEWASNSMKGFADLVIVAEKDNNILGFSTLKYKKPFYNDEVVIAEGQLAGVLNTCRGHDLNTQMLIKRLNISHQYADFYEVGTQIYNYASQRTFYKCGLKPMDSYFSFHMSI